MLSKLIELASSKKPSQLAIAVVCAEKPISLNQNHRSRTIAVVWTLKSPLPHPVERVFKFPYSLFLYYGVALNEVFP